MINTILAPRERLLLEIELVQFFFHRRSLHLVPLLMGGVFLMAWIYPVGSPFAPVIIVVIVGLESQFNNIFFRTPKELEAMALFPMSWENIVIVKNLATMVLAMLLLIIASMALMYFSPEAISFDKFWNAFCYCSTIIFALVHFGNGQSARRPRRYSGFQLDDVIEATWMLVNLAIVSIPAYVIMGLIQAPALCLVYGVGTAMYWYRVPVKRTAGRIRKGYATICSSL